MHPHKVRTLLDAPNTTPHCTYRRANPPRDRAAISQTARRVEQAGKQEGQQARREASRPARKRSKQASGKARKTRAASRPTRKRSTRQPGKQASKQASRQASKEGRKPASQNPQLVASAERTRDVDNLDRNSGCWTCSNSSLDRKRGKASRGEATGKRKAKSERKPHNTKRLPSV